MTFIIGRGFVELQILKKKWKWLYLLNQVEYYDEVLHAHWYWQDIAQGIVKCYLSLVEALPRSKFRLVRHLTVCEVVCPRTVCEKCPKLLNHLEYFNKILHTHWYWQGISQEIAKWQHRLRLCRAPKSKFYWTEWNIVLKFCIHIDIDKTKRLSNVI